MFVSFEQQERIKAFDRLIDETAQVLAHASVRQRLGSTVLQLQDRLEAAVMPNYCFNTLSLPAEYVDSEKFAVMPVLNAEDRNGYILDPSIVTPTPYRRTAITQQMTKHGRLSSHADGFIEKSTDEVCKSVLPAFKPATLARHSAYRRTDSDTGALYISRPIILSRVDETDSILGIGSRISHELTHSIQSEALTEEPDDIPASLVGNELEAYRTEHDIVMALMAHPVYDTDMALSSTSLMVEGWRRRYTHPDRPYEATPILMQKMREYKLLDHRSTGMEDWQ